MSGKRLKFSQPGKSTFGPPTSDLRWFFDSMLPQDCANPQLCFLSLLYELLAVSNHGSQVLNLLGGKPNLR
jgi:hypothetical protein